MKPGRRSGGRRTSKHGGAEGPGRRLQRAGPTEAVPTCEAARPRRDAGHGLRGAEGRRGPAGAGAPAARAGQVGRRGAERPAAGRPHRLQPEHPGEDEVRPGGDGRLHPGGRRGTPAEQERRDGGGDDGNFAVTPDLGNEFATLDRELPEAVHRTKRPEDRNATAVVDRGIQTLKKDLATRVARKGGQWGDHFERAAGAYNARPHETAHGAPEDVEKQPATEFRVLQDNADKFQHNKDLTDRRMKAVKNAGADERGEELQPSVRRRAAAGGRGLHDRPQHGGPGDPAEAGAAGAAGQRQRGGPTDETGQAGGCKAAGRLPGASEAQDHRLAFI